VAYEGILVGYSGDHLLSYKVYVPKLNMLIITSDVIFQEHDEDGQPYNNIGSTKPLEFESRARDLSDFLYLKGSMHRDPEDGLLYITKIVKIDSNSNIIGIRKCIKSDGKEFGKVLHNDPIMIRDIEEMTIQYKNEMVKLAKKTLKPSVYEDTRHVIENLRVIPQPGGPLTLSNYASKRNFSVVNNENILRMEGASTRGNIVGRILKMRA